MAADTTENPHPAAPEPASLRKAIDAIDHDRLTAVVPQGSMQHRPVFCVVDMLAIEHRLDLIRQIGIPGQLHQHFHRLVSYAVLGVVIQDVIYLQLVLFESFSIRL